MLLSKLRCFKGVKSSPKPYLNVRFIFQYSSILYFKKRIINITFMECLILSHKITTSISINNDSSGKYIIGYEKKVRK